MSSGEDTKNEEGGVADDTVCLMQRTNVDIARIVKTVAGSVIT